jgi:hypothetical protein
MPGQNEVIGQGLLKCPSESQHIRFEKRIIAYREKQYLGKELSFLSEL